MTEPKVTDEMLMAYVDDELDAPARDRIAELVAGDASLKARVVRFERSSAVMRELFAPVRAEAPPHELVATALGTKQDLGPMKTLQHIRRWAVAASVAILAGLAGFAAGGDWWAGDTDAQSLLAAATGPDVVAALSTSVSGTPVQISDDITAVAGASYPSEEGICRTYEAQVRNEGGVTGLVCQDGESWTVSLAMQTGEGDYRPASDAATGAIDFYLDTIGAGGALDLEAEAELISRGWSR